MRTAVPAAATADGITRPRRIAELLAFVLALVVELTFPAPAERRGGARG